MKRLSSPPTRELYMPKPQPEETIKVYNNEFIREMLRDSTITSHLKSESSAMISPRTMERNERRREKFRIIEQERQRILQEKDAIRAEKQKQIVERNARQREEDFQKRYSSLNKEAATFVKRVDKFLATQHESRAQSLRGLHSQWLDKIFEPAAHSVVTRVNKMKHEDIIARNEAAMNAFLDVSNRKQGALFLDVVIGDEYNPQAMLPPLKYQKPKDEDDPLKAAECKNKREGSLIEGNKEALPLGRADIAKPELYGRYSVMNAHSTKLAARSSTPRKPPPPPMCLDWD